MHLTLGGHLPLRVPYVYMPLSRCLFDFDPKHLYQGYSETSHSMTYTRAGVGGMVPDAQGRLYDPPHSLARWAWQDFDGDGVRETPTLLLEPRATNECIRSQELDNAAWTPSFVTVSANARRAPDGTLTADDVVETAVNNAHYLSGTGVTIAAGAYCTYSAFVKRRSSTDRFWGMIAFENGADRVSMHFRLDTLALVTAALGTATVTDNGIEAYADGWYRVWVTGRVNVASTAISHWVRIFDDSGNSSYLGVVTKGLSYWGVQFEEGNTTGSSLTSYLPTAGSSVQRATESESVGTLWSVNNVPDSMTLYARFARPSWYQSTGSREEYGYLLFGGANARIGLSFNRDANTVGGQLSDGASTFANISYQSIPTTPVCDICVQFDQLRSAPRGRQDVGGGFNAWSANTLLPITTWGSAVYDLGVPSSPQYNPKTGIARVRLMTGLLTLDEMRNFG